MPPAAPRARPQLTFLSLAYDGSPTSPCSDAFRARTHARTHICNVRTASCRDAGRATHRVTCDVPDSKISLTNALCKSYSFLFSAADALRRRRRRRRRQQRADVRSCTARAAAVHAAAARIWAAHARRCRDEIKGRRHVRSKTVKRMSGRRVMSIPRRSVRLLPLRATHSGRSMFRYSSYNGCS